MMNHKTNNGFDAVDFMRNIRNKLSEEYNRDPDKEEKDLIEVRKKYGIKSKEKIEL